MRQLENEVGQAVSTFRADEDIWSITGSMNVARTLHTATVPPLVLEFIRHVQADDEMIGTLRSAPGRWAFRMTRGWARGHRTSACRCSRTPLGRAPAARPRAAAYP